MLAPAKINLGLHVNRRRSDGYHDIRTVFIRVPWSDRLEAVEADDLSMTCSDPAIPTDDRNLCLRAARALQAAGRVVHGARLHLEKRIPVGAGLGGGSSDAAATLLLLNDRWGLDFTRTRLMEIAATLGSDVPFFLNGPAAVGEGRGERLTPLLDRTGDAYVLPFAVCVIAPNVSVSTGEAYDLVMPRVDRGVASGPDLLDEVVRSNDLERWRSELVNDFEEPILARYPEIAAVRDLLMDSGAGYAALSGSGSAVFGVFEEEAGAIAAAEAGRAAGARVWAGRVEL